MKNFTFRKFMVFFIFSATVALAYQIPYLRYTFYDQFGAAYQLTNTQIGFTATAVSLASTLSYPIGGILADKFSTRNLMLITLGAHVILTLAFAVLQGFVPLMIIHVLYGFFGIATLWSAYLNGIRNLADADNQSKIFGFSEGTRGVVQTIMGFAFLGILAVAATEAAGFRGIMFFAAGVCALLFILAFFFLPKTETKHDDAEEESDVLGTTYSFGQVLKDPGVWITIFIVMFAYLAWTIGNTYLTTYTVQVLNITPATASAIGIFRSYIIVLFSGFIGGFVLDKFTFKGKGFVIFFAAVIAATIGVMTSSAVVPLSVGLTLLIAFIANVMKSTYWSVMGQAGIPLKMTPMATAVISFIAFIPDFLIGPIAGNWLDTAKAAGNIADGFNKIFILLIVSSILGIISSIILMRRTKRLGLQKSIKGADPR